MLVREWMTAKPKTVGSETTIFEAQKLMLDGGFRRLPVVAGGRLIGIVTDSDLREASPSKATTLSVYELNYLLSKLSVKEVMTKPVLSVHPADPIEAAALLMDGHRVSGLPVVEGGEVVGIISVTDILRAFVNILKLKKGSSLKQHRLAAASD